jgi:hypothetical protein
MNVFADFHHSELYRSLQLLFEKRLGWSLYRPIGESWFTHGYWKLAEPYQNNPVTIKQFLSTETATWDPFVNLNGNYTIEDGIYHIYDPIRKSHQKAITYEKFMEMPIDIVISSYQPHDLPFRKLADSHPSKPKLISQMGNIYQRTDIQNVMCSTMPYPIPAGKNVVFYHQQFDTEIFKYVPSIQSKKITSFVMLLPDGGKYYDQKAEMPDYEFKAYGMGCPDGVISGLEKIAEEMQQSMFGWHVKPQGDGFGHVIHNWAASGRPIITQFSDYGNKLAGQLLRDGETAINIDGLHSKDIAKRIRDCSEPERHKSMCEATYQRFTQVCDFDKEFEQIKLFLSNMI